VDEQLPARARAASLHEAECLVERLASSASSSWLSRRRVRQKRISSPAERGTCSVGTLTEATVAGGRSGAIYLPCKERWGVTREVIDLEPLPGQSVG
jgi:hypothetical protein